MKYFIGDTHFGDRGIIKHERTQFKTIEEHDQFVIESVNKRVKTTDELYILGDIGNPEMLRYLNGTKYIILGNHDKRSKKEYQAFAKEVHSYPFYLNRRILLSHEPHPVIDSVLNVHGHLHGSEIAKDNYYNTSFHQLNYKPVSLTELGQVVATLPLERAKFLEEWYADLYRFTEEKSDVVVGCGGRIDMVMTRKLREKLYNR